MRRQLEGLFVSLLRERSVRIAFFFLVSLSCKFLDCILSLARVGATIAAQRVRLVAAGVGPHVRSCGVLTIVGSSFRN